MKALDEFIQALTEADKKPSDIDYGYIFYQPEYTPSIKLEIVETGRTLSLVDLATLDFEYDNGYGSQELFGEIIFKDGSWLERGEYDGSEWWSYKKASSKKSIKSKLDLIKNQIKIKESNGINDTKKNS